MCRFVAYRGETKLLLSELLEKPNNSLIKQSHAAKEGTHGINADGFGVAWYNHKVDTEPGIFKSIQPAWNDSNLRHVARMIRSHCFLGHVRASTVGDVTITNCHPFSYGDFALVHNGTIKQFQDIKRELLAELDDDLFFQIKGQTDSECLFYLIMSFYKKTQNLEEALKKAFSWVEKAQAPFDEMHFSRLNIVITDGYQMIVTRYVNKGHEALSLNYSLNHLGQEQHSVVISSEPLDDHAFSWHELPVNHYLIIKPTLEIELKAF